MKWLSKIPFLVLDTETTGLEAGPDEPVEIGALRCKGEKIVQFHTIVWASEKALARSEEAFKINHMTAERVRKEGIPLKEARDKLRKFSANVGFILGHNIGFDLRMLNGGEEKPSSTPLVDTQALARMARMRALALEKLYTLLRGPFGNGLSGEYEESWARGERRPVRADQKLLQDPLKAAMPVPHTALGDCYMTLVVGRALLERMNVRDLQEAVQLSDEGRVAVRRYFAQRGER